MLLDGKKFTESKSSPGLLVAEISDLQLKRAPSSFTLTDVPEVGQHRSFSFVKCDESGGDVAGWNYEEMTGPNKGRSWKGGHPPKSVPVLRVLIIND